MAGSECAFLWSPYGTGKNLTRLVSWYNFTSTAIPVKEIDYRESLPVDLHPALLQLLLDNLSHAVSPSNPYSTQPANALVVRKLFGTVCGIPKSNADFSSLAYCFAFLFISSLHHPFGCYRLCQMPLRQRRRLRRDCMPWNGSPSSSRRSVEQELASRRGTSTAARAFPLY